jgi:hypothetical protein
MSRVLGSILLLSVAAGSAFAQSEGSVQVGKPPQGVKLAKAECEALWTKANPTKKPKISAGQAQPFITDIKAANANSDAAIDQSEFLAACDKGLMKDQSASTGAGSGTDGAGPAAAPTPVPGAPTPAQ